MGEVPRAAGGLDGIEQYPVRQMNVVAQIARAVPDGGDPGSQDWM